MKKCPECNNSWPEEHLYCPICGTDLVSERDGSGISMGNANAISGGVHSSDDHSKKDSDNVVNSNNETHTNSHNTTNNTTIYEAEKSASEKLEENRLKYRLECKKHFHEGLISREGELHLRELQVYLNLADELALPIKEEVRQQSRRRKTQLSSVGKNEIRLTKSIIEQNTISNLQRQLDKLEVYMQEYDDDALKLMYYQMSSMLEPVRYTNRYEDSAKDEYWEVYWAYIAYMLQERDKQAVEALVSLDRWHGYYHEQNCDILNIVGQLMQNELEETIKSKRDALNNYAPELKTLLEAIDELLEMDWTKESISIRPTHSFYINTLFGRFVETQKIIGKQRLKEIKEQEKRKQEEEKRTKQAELDLQNQIQSQKAYILQRFKETGRIETACQEVGVAPHTLNTWLEEDPAFASSYNDIVRCMEVKKREEEEKKRKQIELEAVDTQQKQAFVTRYGAYECDMLKTCAEIGVSVADCKRWRATDATFNDRITYIERENEQRLIEIKEQERIKREEEERNKQAELDLQNQIKNQKATILQKFQETGKIETACQEAGVDSHTFNVWLEEDQNFASMYTDSVHCMEIKREEEAEKKRKQAEQEAVDTQQKQAFVTRYGANDCDMLKTCTEIGASMADCRRWRATDTAFNDQITYIERERKSLLREASNCRKKRMVKKLLPYLIAIIVIIAGCFAVKTYKEQKEAELEAERIEQYNRDIKELELYLEQFKKVKITGDNFYNRLSLFEKTVNLYCKVFNSENIEADNSQMLKEIREKFNSEAQYLKGYINYDKDEIDEYNDDIKKIDELINKINLCLVTTLNVAADEVDKIIESFNKGDYEVVKSRVEELYNISPIEYNDEFVKKWTDKCNKAIKVNEEKEKAEANAQEAIAAARKKEAKAKQREKEKEERLQKEKERKQNKLVYISAEATTIGGKEYAGMSSAIKADGVKFTDKEELAYWSVHITAEVKDHHTKENDYNGKKMKKYYSTVVAYLTIVNNITDSIIHQEEIRKESNSTQDYERAVNTAYQDINKKIWNKIQELCK